MRKSSVFQRIATTAAFASAVLLMAALALIGFSPSAAASSLAAEPVSHEAKPHEAKQKGHAASGHAPAAKDGHDAHDGHHAPAALNWAWGLLGESDDARAVPSLWQRPKGMPAPLLAMVFNAVVFFWILVRFGRQPVAEGLRKRKHDLMQGIEQAAKMQAEARGQLDEYQAKLDSVDQEIERVKTDMRALADAERRRIIVEAEAVRTRMLRDAEELIRQEIEGAKEILRVETARRALASAERLIQEKVDAAENERLQGSYLHQLERLVDSSFGGRA